MELTTALWGDVRKSGRCLGWDIRVGGGNFTEFFLGMIVAIGIRCLRFTIVVGRRSVSLRRSRDL